MKPVLAFALILFGFTASASAQRSLGYWFAAPGGITTNGHTTGAIHLGGGGEIAVWKGASIGIEGGAIGPFDHYVDNVQGIASLDGVYHFFHSQKARFDPFAETGYSLLFRKGTANLWNYGGGLNYWATRHMAVRVEVRDHVQGSPFHDVHYWGIRFGVSFTQLQP